MVTSGVCSSVWSLVGKEREEASRGSDVTVLRETRTTSVVVSLSELEFLEGCSYPALCVTTSTVVLDEQCVRKRDFRRCFQLDREVGCPVLQGVE